MEPSASIAMVPGASSRTSRRTRYADAPFTLARPLIAAAMVTASVLGAIAQQPPTPTRVRGTIEGVDGDVLMVKSRSGEDVKLHMTSDMRVVGIVKISLADIKLGSFIGTTTVPGAGWPAKCGRGARLSGKHARHRRGIAALRSASRTRP